MDSIEDVEGGEVFLVEASISGEKLFGTFLGVSADQEICEYAIPFSTGFEVLLPLCPGSICGVEIQQDYTNPEGLQGFVKKTLLGKLRCQLSINDFIDNERPVDVSLVKGAL